jgi:WD40 repeat protein
MGSIFDLLLSLNNELLSSSGDQTIKIWHLDTFELVKSLGGFKFWTGKLTLLNNQTFASSNDNDPLIIFNFPSGKIRHLLFGHTNDIYSVVYLDELYLASGSEDNTIIVWNHQTGEDARTLVNDGHVYSLALLENGHLASAVGVSLINIWNYTSGLLLDTFYATNCYKFASAKMGNLAFSNRDEIVIMYALDRYNLSCKSTNLMRAMSSKRLTHFTNQTHLAYRYEI